MVTLIQREQLFLKTHKFIDSAFGTPAPEHRILVEVGPYEQFDFLHLKGAIHMTLQEVEDQAEVRLPDHGAEIILYGQNGSSLDPKQAIRILEKKGYFNLYFYQGGKEDWIRGGLETQSSLVPADHFKNIKS